MSTFIERLGHEVRRRRQSEGLTVQGLAGLAGLSRRMLTQIEQGTANPSLVTVDKIARALGVDFAALAASPATEPLHVSTAVEVWRSAAGSRAVLHVSSARRGGPELWEWTLQSGDRYQAQPDPPGSEELFLVTAGTLVLETADRTVTLPAGDSARLASDRVYSYAAPSGAAPATFIRVVELGPPRPLLHRTADESYMGGPADIAAVGQGHRGREGATRRTPGNGFAADVRSGQLRVAGGERAGPRCMLVSGGYPLRRPHRSP